MLVENTSSSLPPSANSIGKPVSAAWKRVLTRIRFQVLVSNAFREGVQRRFELDPFVPDLRSDSPLAHENMNSNHAPDSPQLALCANQVELQLQPENAAAALLQANEFALEDIPTTTDRTTINSGSQHKAEPASSR